MRRLASLETSPPSSRWRRVLQRPNPVPRSLALLSDLYTFPVASLQSSRNRLQRGTSPTQLSPLAIFDSSEPAQSPTPPTAIPKTPDFPQQSTSGLHPRLAFLGLPPELRNQIYMETLGPRVMIHTVHPRMAPDDYFLFLRCSMPIGESGECPGCEYLETDDLRSDHDVVDMSLLLVSQEVRDEASAIIFSRNHFWFPRRSVLHDFGRTFPNHAKHMQMVSFSDIYDDSQVEKSIDTFQYYGRWMRKDFLAVKAITIYVQVLDTSSTKKPVFEEGILNYFRPLSSLPLSQAHVKLSMGYGGDQRISQEMLQVLCAKAESILLLDTSLPEQEMQRLPQDANPGTGTYVPARILSNPDQDLSCADCSQAWLQGSSHALRSMMDAGLPCRPSLACVSLRFEARYCSRIRFPSS